ncbi:MAG: ABC-F family ATP-binding cassette domain-containing protein [Paracoccaceae bacterium]
MLGFRNISFSMAGKPLIENASAVIPAGHKVGLVGRNGTGKTTLFRLIRGELPLDAGEIETPRGARIGGVAQEAPAGADSLLDTVLSADTERQSLMAAADRETDPMRIAEIQTRLADIEAHSAEARAAVILQGLGFDSAAQARSCAEFSGGWRMRVALASLLFARPDILLLDEPTNYLDLEGTVWLEAFLARYPHTILIISHDRHLLNRAVGSILHLHERKLTLYSGNYDTFDETRRARLAQQAALKKKQDAERAHMQSYVDRFRYKATKARQAQSRLKALARMQPIAAAADEHVADFRFPEPKTLSPPIVRLEDVSVGYQGQPVLRGIDLRIDQDDRIALLGANGEGKSTLAKLVSGKLDPMDGKLHRAGKLRVGYFAQHQIEELDASETPLQHLRRLRDDPPAKLRACLAAGGIGPDVADIVVDRLSGGQKARLSLLLATLEAPQLIILDEPTNHLDIQSRDALVRALTDYNGAVILVSHDTHLVECVADRLWLVRGGRVSEFREDLDAYRDLLLKSRATPTPGNGKRAGNAKSRSPARRLSPDRARREVSRCEERVSHLESLRKDIDRRLSAADFWQNSDAEEQLKWQRKRSEIEAALERADALWLQALELLEQSEQSA